MRRTVLWVILIGVPIWLTVEVVRGVGGETGPRTVAAATANVVVLAAWIGLMIEMAATRRSRPQMPTAWWRKPFVWLAAATVMSPAATKPATPVVVAAVAEPATVVSPAMAGWAMAMILERRRASILGVMSPRRLTDEELRVLAMLRREAREMNTTQRVDVAVEVAPMLPHHVAGVLAACDETRCDEDVDADAEWVFMVKVMGHPEVMGRDGRRVVFRKGRSLELAVWLALNRDRMSRSLARTAMWDIDVSDATFATVVSEMRRALHEAVPALDRDEISRATFTDDLHLHDGVITDVEVLRKATTMFVGGQGDAESLAAALSLVRGLPFAGTSYEWADLDGTTTRIVIAVIDAAVRLGEWAVANGRFDVAGVALTAGMRVMPGHPEMERLEREMLTAVRG